MLKLRKVQALYAQKFFSRASSDTYLKWLLGPDQDLVFTFSNPVLKSAVHAFKISLNDRSNGDREVQC